MVQLILRLMRYFGSITGIQMHILLLLVLPLLHPHVIIMQSLLIRKSIERIAIAVFLSHQPVLFLRLSFVVPRVQLVLVRVGRGRQDVRRGHALSVSQREQLLLVRVPHADLFVLAVLLLHLHELAHLFITEIFTKRVLSLLQLHLQTSRPLVGVRRQSLIPHILLFFSRFQLRKLVLASIPASTLAYLCLSSGCMLSTKYFLSNSAVLPSSSVCSKQVSQK